MRITQAMIPMMFKYTSGQDISEDIVATRFYGNYDGALLGFELESGLIAAEASPPPAVEEGFFLSPRWPSGRRVRISGGTVRSGGEVSSATACELRGSSRVSNGALPAFSIRRRSRATGGHRNVNHPEGAMPSKGPYTAQRSLKPLL